MRTAAVVPAAGRGERLGPGAPKALRELGGVPMLVHAVRTLSRARSVDIVVVAAPADDVPDAARPLAPVELVDAVVAAVRAGADAVVPGQPVADTVKEVDASARVLRT